MTASHAAIDNIYRYYTDIVVGKQERSLGGEGGGLTIADWIGRFRPNRINVIPLFEEMDHMLDAHTTVRRYLEGKDIADQRVFLARSDPAMNYGLVSAVLLNKIALLHIQEVSEETGDTDLSHHWGGFGAVSGRSLPPRGPSVGLPPSTRASTRSPSSRHSSTITRLRMSRMRSGGWRSEGPAAPPGPSTRQRLST